MLTLTRLFKSIVATSIFAIAVPSSAYEYPVEGSVVASIEDGSYKPCDQPNAYGISDCAWGYAAIADSKIRRLEKDIVTALGRHKTFNGEKRRFQLWQREWRDFRDRSCNLSNSLANTLTRGQPGVVPNGTDFHLGFCMKRFNEERVTELSSFLELANE